MPCCHSGRPTSWSRRPGSAISLASPQTIAAVRGECCIAGASAISVVAGPASTRMTYRGISASIRAPLSLSGRASSCGSASRCWRRWRRRWQRRVLAAAAWSPVPPSPRHLWLGMGVAVRGAVLATPSHCRRPAMPHHQPSWRRHRHAMLATLMLPVTMVAGPVAVAVRRMRLACCRLPHPQPCGPHTAASHRRHRACSPYQVV